MRQFLVAAAIPAAMVTVLGLAEARASVDQPERWECVSVARAQQLELYLEKDFGALPADSPFHRAGARSPQALEPLIREADAREERWGAGVVLTDAQVDFARQLTAGQTQAVLENCAAMLDDAGTRAPLPADLVPPAAASRMSFAPEPGTDRFGNDIGMVEVAPRDFDACRRQCEANSSCVAFTLYTPPPFSTGYCWMKSAAGPPTASEYSISAVR